MKLSTPALKYILVLITVAASIVMYLSPKILQDYTYHQFADRRTIFSVPNFCNVISNLIFLWVGIMGLYKLHKKRLNIVVKVQWSYYVFFIAVILISFGSAYYHWQPNNLSLVWDRLPITFAFMSLLSFVLAENLSVNWGRSSLLPLLFFGLLSIGYWYWGNVHGAGDLRLYALVQFLPLVLLLVLLLFGQSIFKNQLGYWALFISYVLAKLAEHFDSAIFTFTSGFVAGHTLKHLLSAFGLYALIIFFERRKAKAILNF